MCFQNIGEYYEGNTPISLKNIKINLLFIFKINIFEIISLIKLNISPTIRTIITITVEPL